MWILYQFAMGAALLLGGPFLLIRRGRHYLASLPGRLGRYQASGPRGAVWLHAVSVGEVGVASTLATALPRDLPLLVTTVTPTGQRLARRLFRGRATVTYLPFDLGFPIRRFFRRFAPCALILTEGDLWPLLLERSKRRRLPVLVVNGRISDRSFRQMRRLGPLARSLLARVDRFAVQTEEDRRRLLALGVEEVRVVTTGNLKFDSPEPEARPELETALERLAAGRPVLVAGSTMEGEEERVLDAFEAVGGGERALLVLAPRHPERWDGVAGLVERRAPGSCRRSRLPGEGRPPVVLLDSLGELAALYRIAQVAFIGGTLVPTGGHNPLEAARFGVPVSAGPSMENFRQIAETFDAGEAWGRVADARELARLWERWLADPAAARALGHRGAELVTRHRGALANTLELVLPCLPTSTAWQEGDRR